MKAAVTLGPDRLEIQERPMPEPAAGEALLRIERAGICGSDLHLYHGAHPYAVFPRIQGHEAAGRIERFGPGYAGSLRVGERVAIEPLIPCGHCYPCRIGRRNCCVNLNVIGAHSDGAFREYIALPTSMLYSTGDLTAEEAALVEPISIGVQAAARGEVASGDQVVIIGAGPIGATIAVACIDRGARVMAVDRLPSRLEATRALGAEAVAVAGEEDIPAAVQHWTNGDGAHVAIDAVGAPAVIRQCCEIVASAGRVVIVGLSQQEVSLPVLDFTRKEMTIHGSRNNAGRFGEAVDLVQRRRDQLRELITHRYPLAEMPEAMAFAAANPAVAEKVMIEFWNG